MDAKVFKRIFFLKCPLCKHVGPLKLVLGGSPGLAVMGGDTCSECCGSKSQHCLLDVHFSHLFVVKIAKFA